MLDLESEFQRLFPDMANRFNLKEIQRKAVTNIHENGNTLCIMPTGGGKSLVYWLSGLLLKGITIVISPLIALIDEQAEKITAQGFEVLAIHGGVDSFKQQKLLLDFANNKINPDFIFVSPEKIATDGLFEFCIKKRVADLRLIVIDEVHCVSQWGFSFRPFYKRIPDFIGRLSQGGGVKPAVLAMTATLNPKEIADICQEFEITGQNIIKDNLLTRNTITLHIQKFNDEKEKESKFWDIVKIHEKEKILVYTYRKYSNHGVEQLSEAAREKGYVSAHFHGDLTAGERREIIERYKKNEINLVFATNAFGMGIDIPDIRVVIHFMIPDSVEQYYQEIGRAARDGKTANAYLLYSNKNIDVKRTYFIDGSFPDADLLENTYKKIAGPGVGLHTLMYFEDEEIQKCLPYYIGSGLIKIMHKGFMSLKDLSKIQRQDLDDIVSCSKTKSIIAAINRSEYSAQQIIDIVYESLVTGEAAATKALAKCLLIDVVSEKIPEDVMHSIQQNIDEKRKYKNELLDYLVYLISTTTQSVELHQEIAGYLGVDKHLRNRIYSTAKGDLVRSKSEVIIANLLFDHGVLYEYEKSLEYEPGQFIEPDFTISLRGGKVFYWEHLGMLGIESYDNRWLEKKEIYHKHYQGQLLVTYEGAALSNSVLDIIRSFKKD